MHQKPTQSDVQRITIKRKLSYIKLESSYIFDFRAEDQLRIVKGEK